jgi:hypothetical protein
MREMTDEELVRCRAFLDAMGVSYDGDIIYLTDGGNSCIMNPKTEWKEFLGCSVNSIAEAVAKKLSKKTEWLD